MAVVRYQCWLERLIPQLYHMWHNVPPQFPRSGHDGVAEIGVPQESVGIHLCIQNQALIFFHPVMPHQFVGLTVSDPTWGDALLGGNDNPTPHTQLLLHDGHGDRFDLRTLPDRIRRLEARNVEERNAEERIQHLEAQVELLTHIIRRMM